MDDEKIRWKETGYKSIVKKYMILFSGMTLLVYTVFIIISDILTGPPIQLTMIIGIIVIIFSAISPLFSLKTAKKRVGYDLENVYYIDRDGRKEKLRFNDIDDIYVPSQEDSGIIVTTKDAERVIVGPGTGGKYGRSLIEEYKRWINENTDKEASVEFVSYDIPFVKWGKYVIDLNED